MTTEGSPNLKKTPLMSQSHPSHPLPSTLTTTTIQALSILRLVAGTAALVAPVTTAKLFLIPTITAGSMGAYQLRLFGIRDAVIGGMLYSTIPRSAGAAEEWKESGKGRGEMRRVLWANVVTDAVDVVVTAAAVATGGIGRPGGLCVGGAAMGFLAMGLVGLSKV